MVDQTEVPPEIVARLRSVCLALPEAREVAAWVGTAWRVRTGTFAHVVTIDRGWPPAYARAAGTDGPATVLTFRSSGDELAALTAAGPPWFKPPWHPQVVGTILSAEPDAGPAPDWTEIGELLTESYCLLAPRSLVDRVDRPSSG